MRARGAPGSGTCPLTVSAPRSQTAFGLPINVALDPKAECDSILSSVRDPVERFISGVGTVWHRTREDMKRCAEQTNDSPCGEAFGQLPSRVPEALENSTFEAYAQHLLLAVRNATRLGCASMLQLGHAMHLLRQSTFITLACAPTKGQSRVYVNSNASDLMRHTCADELSQQETFHEGRLGHELSLSSSLRSEVVAFYKPDSELLGTHAPGRTIFGRFDQSVCINELTHDRVIAGLRASVQREERATAAREVATRCAADEAPLCTVEWRAFGENVLRCECESAIFGPPPRPAALIPDGGGGVAVLVAGEARSFLHATVQQFYKSLITSIRVSGRDPMLFVVLGTRWKVGRFPWLWAKGETVREVTHAQVVAALDALGAPYELIATADGGTWNEASEQARDPQLKAMLTVSRSDRESRLLPNGGGIAAGWMKRLLALDMLLQYEKRQSAAPDGKIPYFEHVLFLRPDMIYIGLDQGDYLRVLYAADEVVLMCNDQWASMPRALAGYYFSTIEWLRAVIRASTTKVGNGAVLEQLRLAVVGEAYEHDKPWSLFSPYPWLAYSGVLFAGKGLEVGTDVPETIQYTGRAGGGPISMPRPVFLRDATNGAACVQGNQAAGDRLREIRAAGYTVDACPQNR